MVLKVVRVVPVRLDDDTLGFIDMLINLGIYNSRSEALRDLIRIGVDELKWMAKVNEAVEKLFKLETEYGEIPIKIKGILEELLRGRDRF